MKELNYRMGIVLKINTNDIDWKWILYKVHNKKFIILFLYRHRFMNQDLISKFIFNLESDIKGRQLLG